MEYFLFGKHLSVRTVTATPENISWVSILTYTCTPCRAAIGKIECPWQTHISVNSTKTAFHIFKETTVNADTAIRGMEFGILLLEFHGSFTNRNFTGISIVKGIFIPFKTPLTVMHFMTCENTTNLSIFHSFNHYIVNCRFK